MILWFFFPSELKVLTTLRPWETEFSKWSKLKKKCRNHLGSFPMAQNIVELGRNAFSGVPECPGSDCPDFECKNVLNWPSFWRAFHFDLVLTPSTRTSDENRMVLKNQNEFQLMRTMQTVSNSLLNDSSLLTLKSEAERRIEVEKNEREDERRQWRLMNFLWTSHFKFGVVVDSSWKREIEKEDERRS